MQINVSVGDLEAIDLSSDIGTEIRDYDHETGAVETRGKTLGDLVAEQITQKLVADDHYREMRKRYLKVRDEEIRAAVAPVVAEALAGPIQKTNSFGEPTGQQTTMRELIMAETQRLVSKGTDSGYSNRRKTFLQELIEKETGRLFAAELSAVMAAEKEKVVAAVRSAGAELLAEAVKKGIGR